MPQRSTNDFLTTQTLRERMGLRKHDSLNTQTLRERMELSKNNHKPTPMATMRVDLYSEIDELENKLDASKLMGVVLKITILLSMIINITLAAIIYLGGIYI